MSRLFISHSSADNAAAVALQGWLREAGWDDVFLDLDPERGIKAGERWERALHDAANRCQAVLFLVSRNWLASHWCAKEFDLAARLDKRMFGVVVDDTAVDDIPPRFRDTWQFIPLSAGRDHEIFRAVVPPDDREVHVSFSKKWLRGLKTGLRAAGVDPEFFAWPPADDPDRPPYSGLPPMEEADAGIFFGRDADTLRALDALRGLARKAPPRIFVIEGASGCGKSSFLRAGLIPRLKRDDRSYRVLPPIRPEQAAIEGAHGLISSLETALAAAGLARDRADLRAVATSPDKLEATLAELARKTTSPAMPGEAQPAPPAIVIPVDQAEELFQTGGADQGLRLLDILSALAQSAQVRIMLLFTIRTDDYAPLQTAAAFEGMAQQIFGLAPIPLGRLGTIIEGPARRMAESGRSLTIEPRLVARLLGDLQAGASTDVLPLCAFILERLWREHGGDGKLLLAEYEGAERGLGGIRGAIEGAVAAAFAGPDRAPSIPADPDARETLLRRALVPALAAIDPETRTPRRRVARFSEIPEAAHPLVERLVAARLLSTDRDPETKERMVEPAHEALLRQWSMMEQWLAEDAHDLLALEAVELAASDWGENARSDGWLVHARGRLEDAERLRDRSDFAARLGGTTGAYLEACRSAETARRDKELADARRIAAEQKARARNFLVGLALSLVLLAATGAATVKAWQNGVVANDRAREAQQSQRLTLAALSDAAFEAGEFDDARKLALLAWPTSAERGTDLTALRPVADSIERSLGRPAERAWLAVFWDEEETWQKLALMREDYPSVLSVEFTPDGKSVLSASSDGGVRLWDVGDVRSWVTPYTFSPPVDELLYPGLHPPREDVAFGDGPYQDAPDDRALTGAFFTRGGDWILLHLGGGVSAHAWNQEDGAIGARAFTVGEDPPSDRLIAISEDAHRVATLSDNDSSTVLIWDTMTGAKIAQTGRGTGEVRIAELSPLGRYLFTAEDFGGARLWDASNGTEIAHLEAVQEEILFARFSPNEKFLLSIDYPGDKVSVWEAATGAPVSVFGSKAWGIKSAMFSPDGNRVVVFEAPDRFVEQYAIEEMGAQIFDTLSGAVLSALEMDTRYGTWAEFSADGRKFLTISHDESNIVRVWDPETGSQVALLEHSGQVSHATFSPDGQEIVTASQNGLAAIWRIGADEGSIFDRACSMLLDDSPPKALDLYGIAARKPICTGTEPAPPRLEQ